MRLYIAGPMDGLPDHNFPAFDAAAKVLRGLGHTVVSPAEMTRAAYNICGGKEICEQRLGSAEKVRQHFIKQDLAGLIYCDGIVFLQGWSDSRGATFENLVVAQTGLKRFVLSRNRIPHLIALADWTLDQASRVHAQTETKAAGRSTNASVKAAHLMDLYAALDCKWGDDPFAAISKLRKNERPPEIQKVMDAKYPPVFDEASRPKKPHITDSSVSGDLARRLIQRRKDAFRNNEWCAGDDSRFDRFTKRFRLQPGDTLTIDPSNPVTGQLLLGDAINFYDSITGKHVGSVSGVPKGDPEEPITLEAHRCVDGARQKAYGHPLDNYTKVARLWEEYITAKYGEAANFQITAEDCMHMMILLKQGRLMNGYHRDSVVDIAGYAECLDMIEKERARRKNPHGGTA